MSARPKAGRWICWLLALSAVFVSINHIPARGRGVPIWDARDSFFPFFVLVADHARAGRLVSWDPWSNAGQPKSSDPEFGAFAPFQVATGLATGGTTTGFIVYWLAIWWCGGLGLFLLARHLRAPGWGAFAVGLGYLFSGVYAGHAEHVSWLIGYSALPFIIWRLDTALLNRRWLPAVEAGALWGMSATGAYPGMTIITGLFLGFWTIGHALFRAPAPTPDFEPHGGTPPERWRHGALALIIVVVVGSLVLLPTYFSFFYEGVGAASRTRPLAREVAVASNALEPGALITAISPYSLSLKFERSRTLWPLTDVSSCSVYAGALGLTLAIVALVARPRDRWRWYLAALVGVSLGVALGPALPLRGWLYDWLYPTRFFRHSSMFSMYSVFALSVLALQGTRDVADVLAESSGFPRKIVAALVTVPLAAVALYFLAAPADAQSGRVAGLGQLHLLVTWGAVAGLAVLCWLMRRPRRSLWVPLLMVLVASGDGIVTARLSRDTVYSTSPGDLEWWDRQDALHSSAIQLTEGTLVRTRSPCESDPPCFEMNAWSMITKVPALSTYTTTTPNVFHDAIAAHPILSQLALGPKRVWFASDVAVVSPDDSSFAAFRRRAEVLGVPSMLLHPREAMLGSVRTDPASEQAQIGELPAAEFLTPVFESRPPDELAFSVQSPRSGWLLVPDRWARSWTASVNDRPAVIFGGNFVFRAVQVTAGLNRIRFVYRPLGVGWLLLVSWGTLAAVATISVARRASRNARSAR